MKITFENGNQIILTGQKLVTPTHSYEPSIHQNCMKPEEIEIVPVVITRKDDTIIHIKTRFTETDIDTCDVYCQIVEWKPEKENCIHCINCGRC